MTGKANKDARARVKVLYRDVVALTDQTTFLSNKINFLLDATLGLIKLWGQIPRSLLRVELL